jgi:hypothetical protein
MIKFFRKIRQNLLMEDKTGKYFKYAIGEIILVVTGILIAIKINNWNENQKKAELGYQYLTEIRNELQKDVKNLNNEINKLEENIKNQEAALNTKDISKLPLDSLSLIIHSINLDFKTSQLTFNKMKNLGITKLSNNDGLNLKITEYYNDDLVSLKLLLNFDFNHFIKRKDFYFFEQNKIDILATLISIREFPSLYNQTEEETEREIKSNLIEFIYSVKGRNLVIYDFNHKKKFFKQFERFSAKNNKPFKIGL